MQLIDYVRAIATHQSLTLVYQQESFTVTAKTIESIPQVILSALLQPIDHFETLKQANKGALSFFNGHRHYKTDFSQHQATAVVIGAKTTPTNPNSVYIQVNNPSDVFHYCIHLVHVNPKPFPNLISLNPNYPHAFVSSTATIHPSVQVGYGAYVGNEAVLHEGVIIGHQTMIDSGVNIGSYSHIHPLVTLQATIVGSEVTIYSGANIGREGFGFFTWQGRLLKIPHIGKVIIGNRVDIGANTTIDRGSIGNTTIGNDTKIDNLVQIGHNCVIGNRVFIAGHSGFAGSLVIEDDVKCGGKSGSAGHLTIHKGATLMGGSLLMHDVEPQTIVFGHPAQPYKEAMRDIVNIKKLRTTK